MEFNQKRIAVRIARTQVGASSFLSHLLLRSAFRTTTDTQKAKLKRLGMIILSLTFFHYLPYLVVCSYMAWEGFFSYDIFANGSGINAFYGWGEIVVLTTTFIFFGFIPLWIYYSENKVRIWSSLKTQYDTCVIAVCVLGMNAMALYSIAVQIDKMPSDQLRDLIALVVVSAIAANHLGRTFFSSAHAAFRSLLMLIGTIAICATLLPGAFGIPYTLALELFGAGGRIPVSIVMKDKAVVVSGELVLAAPENLYVSHRCSTGTIGCTEQIQQIGRDRIDSFTVSHRKIFGHN